ncbi:MAG: SMI1/KNR4 family protein [Kangiellaceae bacterium]|jgi:hypothetical protein|nr:SMI1/KNR4 family protein [Kangiellaceae bacterium]
MNELVDELRELNEDRFSSMELPTIDDLVIIEEQILIPLPAEFKEFLMNVSDVVYGHLEPVTVSDSNLHTYLPEVASVAWDRGMPREYIPICQVGNDYYCVEQDGTVLFWRDGTIQEQHWDSVWQWVKEVWLDQTNEF